jgi:hypothetical protein
MARRTGRRPLRGRTQVALGLVAFLAITSLVAWRRSLGIAEARAISALTMARRELETERVTLQRGIREAMRGERIVREAGRRLGLGVARETQLRTVVVAPAASPEAPAVP